ncbi:MAG: BamA/TamA family outer membrane protein, partial [Myxococcota bacterium]
MNVLIPLLLASGVASASALASANTETAVAGPEYDRSFLGRQALGDNYRELWTTPIEAPVLNLQHYAGGLRPVRTVGGGQTVGLAFEGADGRAYTFRPVNKDGSRHLPADQQGSLSARIHKDQGSAAHPASSVIVTPLAGAAGVLHTTPRLVVMPDSPRLGEFRETFAGTLGTIDVFPQAASEGRPGFAGALEIISTDELFERIRKHPDERVDSPGYVRARLFDAFIGDWDRHGGNWRWAKLRGRAEWVPLPEDRDLAFANYEGIMLFWARFFDPRLITFRAHYPSTEGLTRQAAAIDNVVFS